MGSPPKIKRPARISDREEVRLCFKHPRARGSRQEEMTRSRHEVECGMTPPRSNCVTCGLLPNKTRGRPCRQNTLLSLKQKVV